MKSFVLFGGFLGLLCGATSTIAFEGQPEGQFVSKNLANSISYSVRSSYKWGDPAELGSVSRQETEESLASEANSSSYKWIGFDDSSTKETKGDYSAALYGEESVGVDQKAAHTAYKWGTKSSAEQSAYKWGTKNSAEQSAYKWGTKNSAEQSAYKWGTKNSAEQSAYKWGTKNSAEQSAYKWGTK